MRVPASWAADVQAMAEQDEWIWCVLGDGSGRPLTATEIEDGIRILKTDPHPICRQAVENVLEWQYYSEVMRELDPSVIDPSVEFHLWCANRSTYTDPDFGDRGEMGMDDTISIYTYYNLSNERFMGHFFRQFLCLPPTATCFQDQCFLETLQRLEPALTSELAPFNWASDFFWRQSLASFKNALERCITSVEATIYFRLY